MEIKAKTSGTGEAEAPDWRGIDTGTVALCQFITGAGGGGVGAGGGGKTGPLAADTAAASSKPGTVLLAQLGLWKVGGPLGGVCVRFVMTSSWRSAINPEMGTAIHEVSLRLGSEIVVWASARDGDLYPLTMRPRLHEAWIMATKRNRRTKLPYEVSFQRSKMSNWTKWVDEDLWRVEKGRLLKNGELHVDLASVDELEVGHYTGDEAAQHWRLVFRGPGFSRSIECERTWKLAAKAEYPVLELHLLDELARLRPDIPVRVANGSFFVAIPFIILMMIGAAAATLALSLVNVSVGAWALIPGILFAFAAMNRWNSYRAKKTPSITLGLWWDENRLSNATPKGDFGRVADAMRTSRLPDTRI